MRAIFELDVGLAKLREIIQSLPSNSSHWNEAQNRFQFVDRLLIECLGWQKPYIEVEHSTDFGGRADYVLGTPVKAVLEAKRESVVFETLPTGSPSTLRKIAPMLKASKPFSSAVEQAIQYCALKGAPIAIICNGPQLAIFQAIIPGQSPLEGECYFFNGFESYLNDFTLLWSLLSPEGVSENRAYRDLALHRNPRLPPKASSAIPEPLKYRYRNHFQENLRSLSSLLLEEIEDNPTLKTSFYQECYVRTEANNRHLLLSKNIISARYKRVGRDGIEPASLETAAAIDEHGGLKFVDPAALNTVGSRPVVVIGDVGVGKSSFFENLYEGLDASSRADTYFIHINLGIKANLAAGIKPFVLSEIPLVLKKKYGVNIEEQIFVESIYYAELAEFDRSVKGALKNIDNSAYLRERIAFLSAKVENRDSHLHASLGHLARGRTKQIILVIDNADQRTFEIQQEAFLIAQELAATRNLLVFVALRPSTFYLSKNRGALSGYQNKLVTIAPPPADEVIEKRLAFAVRVAQGKVAPAALENIRLQLGNVVAFLNATLRSIRLNEAIRRFLSNITGGNTRAVIELITGFFGSPNVDSEKIVRIENESGDYKVPLHEFTKHALLGEYAYFNSQSSQVACNIFDVHAADPREHFLASLIVGFLSSNLGVRDNDGFVGGRLIIDEMTKHGFVEEQVAAKLKSLAEKRLIETPYAHFRELLVADHELPNSFHFRATSVGIYHVRYWTGAFGFMDATATDTPIFDEPTRERIMQLASSFDIRDRYQKARTFCAYLENQWHLANVTANYYDFTTIMKQNEESFDAVKAFIDKGRDKAYGYSRRG